MIEKLFLVLKNLTNSILSITRVAILSKKASLPNVNSGKTEIQILGNGPSLNGSLKENFKKDSDFMSVNFMPNSPIYENIKPSYHILTAPEFFMGDPTHEKKLINDELFSNIVKKTNWPLIIYIGSNVKDSHKYVTYLKSNKHISIYKVNLTPVEGHQWLSHKFFNWGWGMPRPHNVLIPSIMISIRMSYKSIYLLGADHSWLTELRVDENNRALLNQKHFYDQNISKEKPMLLLAKRERKLHEILHKFYLSFKAYHTIKKYADTKRVNIYNCTPGSFIDAFERLNVPN